MPKDAVLRAIRRARETGTVVMIDKAFIDDVPLASAIRAAAQTGHVIESDAWADTVVRARTLLRFTDV